MPAAVGCGGIHFEPLESGCLMADFLENSLFLTRVFAVAERMVVP